MHRRQGPVRVHHQVLQRAAWRHAPAADTDRPQQRSHVEGRGHSLGLCTYLRTTTHNDASTCKKTSPHTTAELRVCPCALLCGTTHARQNIGLADGGVTKNENKRGLRDTTVHVSDFGPHLVKDLPGMIDPANPVQFGHYPAVGDTTARYDAGGPRLGKDDGTGRLHFQVPADALPGKRLQFQYRNTRVEYIVKRDDQPGDEIQVDILKPGHEWWRGMRKGKAQLLWETGWVNPTISANIGAEWINDWAHGYQPTEQELKTKTRTSDGKKNATLFLDQRKDFAGEQTVVEKLFCRYGHLVIASPRYHPELAGLGIEYCWGKAKWCFRRYVNDLVSTNLEKNVLIALGSCAYPTFGTGAECPAPSLSKACGSSPAARAPIACCLRNSPRRRARKR